MEKFLFDNQDNLIRIAFSAPVIYAIVILYIRLVGKRATSQMNSFDWIVTVAMGSLVASTIILKDISILEGAFSILLLLLMQLILTKLMVHSSALRKVVRSSPQLLVYNGEFLEDNMASERIVKNEILSAIRHRGVQNIKEVHAVVLETDATFSVITKEEDNAPYTLADVQGLPEGLKEDLEKRNEKED
ncbi:DUF421 domain-containing protein [Ulvibacterium marinum]|uniref:DUF421 domain-containing protein n=1 Tax=Ulvibacterium marinum TaxID=2419782 RepID=A0A3B0CEH4_9FLAO|nr:YetF domain-containing protein [Ulvibacterium marinum]RKN83501.1 DUF421 domain-containing protein [Ulvibacterium marinum]